MNVLSLLNLRQVCLIVISIFILCNCSNNIFRSKQKPIIHFIDKEINSFSHLIIQDSTIFSIGVDYKSTYLFKFDDKLNLKFKKRIHNRLYNSTIKILEDSFVIKGKDNKISKAVQFDFIGNTIDTLNTNYFDEITENIIHNNSFDLKIETNEKKQSKLILSVTSGKILQTVDLDFSLIRINFSQLSDQKLVISGTGRISPSWSGHSFGLIFLSDEPKSHLRLFQQNDKAKMMELAYSQKDKLVINKLFNEWHHLYKPKNTKILLKEWEKETYLIFKQIYPNLLKPRRKVDGSLIYNPEYHLIDVSLQIEISDSINVPTVKQKKRLSIYDSFYKPSKTETINDFRPFVSIDKKIIYCNSNIEESLMIFLSHFYGNPDKLEDRIKFLEDKITIIPAHWVGAPNIYSQPVISKIIFNTEYNKAILRYTNVGHSFSRVYYEKKNGKWDRIRVIASMVS
ncbi:MAG: hypothetical protein K8S23_08990 [Candidatus Cloacimonetes bacterium]|nr:hypothetical protein [Candidatus Cloacimonadota bacterium]